MKLLALLLLISACSSQLINRPKTKKEIEKRQIHILNVVRPLLVSDEFEFMKCKKLKDISVKKDEDQYTEFWKDFGHLELRELAAQDKANIVTLAYSKFGKIDNFTAELFLCNEVRDAKEVSDIGMCKPEKSRIFKIKYAKESLRDVGREILRQKVRYYAITNHYKTFSFKDVKYSYTKKEFSAKASFYKCL